MLVKISILKNSLITLVLISQFAHIIPVYGKGYSQQTDNCGEWTIEDENSDARISASFKNNDSNDDCSAELTLTNETELLGLFGGYTFEIIPFLFDADVEWIPEADSQGKLFLLPSILKLEMYATPTNIQNNAEVLFVGAITVESFSIDASLWLLETGLAFAPIGCLIPEEQLFLLALRLHDILIPTNKLLFEGEIIQAYIELKSVLPEFYDEAKEELPGVGADIGIDCVTDLFDKIIPLQLLDIGFAYFSWIGNISWDLIIENKAPPEIRFIYSPEESSEPSGQVAYLIGSDEKYQIEILDLDSKNLGIAAEGTINSFSWTPDGNGITFSESSIDGNGPSEPTSKIFMIDLTKNTKQILVEPESFYWGGEHYYHYSNPRWSSNEEYLFYKTDDYRAQGDSILRMNKLSKDIDKLIENIGFTQFDISPIDHNIAIIQYFNGLDGMELTINDLNGRLIRTIIDAKELHYLCCPSFSPDGRNIAFSAFRGRFGGDPLKGPTHIWIYNLDDSSYTQITSDDEYWDSEPSWSPDGQWIAFTRNQVGTIGSSDIWISSIEDDITIQITNVVEITDNTSARESHWRRSDLQIPQFTPGSSTPAPQLSATEFLNDYFGLINQSNYEKSWSQLSESFKSKFNPPSRGGYTGYKNWWDTVAEIQILSSEIISDDGSNVVIDALIRFSYKDGRVVDDHHTFLIIRNGDHDWFIDDQY